MNHIKQSRKTQRMFCELLYYVNGRAKGKVLLSFEIKGFRVYSVKGTSQATSHTDRGPSVDGFSKLYLLCENSLNSQRMIMHFEDIRDCHGLTAKKVPCYKYCPLDCIRPTIFLEVFLTEQQRIFVIPFEVSF